MRPGQDDTGGSGGDSIGRFLAVARRDPSAAAVLRDGERTSYAALERKVRVLAGLFAAAAEAPCVLVALPPGASAYAAMLAAGLAGGYYVPVNLAAPAAKIERVCRIAAPDVVIGEGPLLDALCRTAPGARRIDAGALPDGAAPIEGDGSRHVLAYMIFTSGSTGTPKGVVIPRPALDHYVGWIGRGVDIGPGDRVSQYANIAFDLSVLEIYGALCHGASLHPPTGQGDRLMPARMVKRERLTHWISVPSVAGLMLQARQLDARHLGSLRRMVFCGEPLLAHQVAAIFEARPDLLLQNTYGPTEATVSMTSVLLTRDDWRAHSLGSIAIGDPIPGMGLHLAGGPSEDEGEIVITGPQLALGYLDAPDKTDAAFRERSGLRGYHTGDWAERRDGQLYHRGRIDLQVKLKGYRIELDEIGFALAHAGYPNACVFKHGEGLVAVVETAADAPLDAWALRHVLRGLIEAHAVPGTVRGIDRLPRNANDKIDRDAVIAWFVEREPVAVPIQGPERRPIAPPELRMPPEVIAALREAGAAGGEALRQAGP